MSYVDDYCRKRNTTVVVEECEDCITTRICDFTCFKRGLIWGVKDGQKPRWALTYQEAEQLDDKPYIDGWAILPKEQSKLSISAGNTKQPIPAELRWEVWERDNFTCQHCGSRKYLEVDHIIPESQGGELCKENMQTLCKTCNRKKGNRFVG